MKDTYTELYNNIANYVESITQDAYHNNYKHATIQGTLYYLFNITLPNYKHIDIIGEKVEFISGFITTVPNQDLYEIKYNNKTLEYKTQATEIATYMLCVNNFLLYYVDILNIKTNKEILLQISFAIITCLEFCKGTISNNEDITDIHETILICWSLLNQDNIKEDINTIDTYINNKNIVIPINLDFRLMPVTNDLISLV